MRIAFFIPYFREGGVETTTHRLAQGFRERGHQVDLLTFGHDSPYLGPDSAFDLVDLDASRTLAAIPGVRAYVADERPDALISTHYFANVCTVVAAGLTRADTTVVLTERLYLQHVLDQQDSLKYRLFPALIRATYPRADVRVAVSKAAARNVADIAGLPHDAVEGVYNPTLTDDIYAKAEQSPDHPWFDEGPPVVVGAGRLADQKDFATLVRAMDRLGHDEARLVVLGEGPNRAALESLVADLDLEERVDFPGYAENPYAAMAAADLFVLSSRFEGMPNVLVEATALETPVVATDCPSGPAELLEDGEYGPLVPVGDPDAMAAAMDAQLADLDAARERLSGIEDTLQQFTPAYSVARYLSLVEEAA